MVGTPDVKPRGLEVTQVIQNLSNTVELIAGKTTFARFHVGHDLEGLDLFGATATLRLTRGADALVLSPVNAGSVTIRWLGGSRSSRDDSFLFLIPPEWRSGSVTFEAGVSLPAGSDVSAADNSITVGPLPFQEGPELCVDLVRLHLHPTTYDFADPGFGPIVRRLTKVYPISDVDGIRLFKGAVVRPFLHWAGSESGTSTRTAARSWGDCGGTTAGRTIRTTASTPCMPAWRRRGRIRGRSARATSSVTSRGAR